MTYKKMLNLINKEFDGQLTPKEKNILEKSLAESEVLRNEREEIFKIRRRVFESGQAEFGPGFEDQVMQKIMESPAYINGVDAFIDSLITSFRKIAFTSALIVLALMIYNVSITGKISLESALGIPQVSVEDVLDPANLLALE